jgi:hypothetical protein
MYIEFWRKSPSEHREKNDKNINTKLLYNVFTVFGNFFEDANWNCIIRLIPVRIMLCKRWVIKII